ncbi:MAG: carboxypeptidase-like regulatory domain-containing protein, partial [Bryobacteraceae bacterium]|nr:carboxypeptidase-like regulatory domain-containing protein [Bryobacteraceae bacterium]
MFEVDSSRKVPGRKSVIYGKLLVLLLTLVFVFTPSTASAQVLYGSLTGAVTDPSQAAIPGATVRARNLSTGVSKETTSNESGIYLFADLQPGTYDITISAKAFGTVTSQGLVIEANRIRRFDATLKVAEVTESITVSAAGAALQTDRSDVNVNVTTREITNLTLGGSMGRNYQSLMALVPGAVLYGEHNSDAGNPQRSLSVNVNGVSRLQNNTKLDGVSIVYPWLPTNTVYVPSAEAIETVNVVTNSYNAEQGMAGGAAVNVTIKSGTNDFHGTAWIFDNNSKFKARNFFQTTP